MAGIIISVPQTFLLRKNSVITFVDMEANAVKLSDKALVTVEVGDYGKFVRIKKNTKNIVFSEKAWRFVNSNVPMITISVAAESDYGLTISTTKELKLSFYRGQTFLSFQEKWGAEKEYVRYVNLTTNEWMQLVDALPLINQLLACDVAYSDKTEETWMLSKDIIQRPGEKDLKYRLVPRMSNEDLNTLLVAELVVRNVNAAVRNECLGCQIDAPGQLAHIPGCLESNKSWPNMVKCHYEAARMFANGKCAFEELRDYMQWDVAFDPECIDDKLLYRCVEDWYGNREFFLDRYPSCPDIVDIYGRLFAKSIRCIG